MKHSMTVLFTHSKKILFALAFSPGCLLLLSSCNNRHALAEKVEQQIVAPKDTLEYEKNMTLVMEEYMATFPSAGTDSSKRLNWQQVLKEAYALHNYRPLWVCSDGLTAKGREMLQFVNDAEFLGLNKELYHYNYLKQLADSADKIRPRVDYALHKRLETGLSHSFFLMALHLDKGVIADTLTGIRTDFRGVKNHYLDLFDKAPAENINALMATLEPDNILYKRYMDALRVFVSKNMISPDSISIRNPKKDSVGAAADAAKALIYHHYLVEGQQEDPQAYSRSLKRFQVDNNLNGDGVLGANTIRALTRDNAQKFQLLAINADRWRKDDIDELPDKFIWINLPAYRLRLIDHDTLVLEKKVVIGRTKENGESPTLQSAIRQIILWPTWTVPQNIIKKEMKSFDGYEVTRGPGWIKVVQPPGLKNSLGAVKLVFPNKYSVYLHDTPAKSLFNSDFRAASHGCIRCQDALQVAATLMMMDTFHITYDTLVAIKDRKIETQTFYLKKGVPIYIRYFTAEADLDGNLKFYADVYKRDQAMIDFIFRGRKAHVPTKREIEYADSLARIKKNLAANL